MTPHPTYNRALWASTLGAVVLVWLALHCLGCSGAQHADMAQAASDTIACEAELVKRVLEADSCNEAQFKVEAAIATMKECKAYPHFQVCALVDGGSRDDH